MSLYIQEVGDFSLGRPGLFIETLYCGLPRHVGEVVHLSELNMVVLALFPKERYRYRFILFNTATACVHRAILHSGDRPGSASEISKEEIDCFIDMLFSDEITRLIQAYADFNRLYSEINTIWRRSTLFNNCTSS